ncbi:MAG TPA: tRNA adenosine(34) deaminase TadA [Tepidisphaeraceae bacterium]|nr:tRNA adenosine(34) deaminase TadA [Tepidisphaeraceae bacterium]
MDDLAAMRLAISLAEQAMAADEVPVGSIVLDPAGQVIGRGFNRRQSDADPTAHAEIIALRQAATELKTWHLDGCTLVVTLEPCAMCAGALVNARISRLVYGCNDPKAGAVRTLFQICDDSRLNHRLEVVSGILPDQCAALLREFFKLRRPRSVND